MVSKGYRQTAASYAILYLCFSGTSFPGIAESSNGTGDTVGQLSSSVVFRGKTDLVVHKAQPLGRCRYMPFA